MIKSKLLKKTDFKVTTFRFKNKEENLFLEKITNSGNNKSKMNVADILLIHGLTFSSHQYDVNYQDYSLARFLAQKGARVWLLDLAGYGRSSKPKDGFIVNGQYAADDIISAVNFIKNKEKVDKINLLGWSFGTISCSLAVAKVSEFINTLILYAPIYYGLNLPQPTSDYQEFLINSTEDDFQKIPGTNIIDPNITDMNLFNLYQEQCRIYDGAGSPNGCRKDLFQPKSVELFIASQLSMPVLVIAGTQDPYLDWNKNILPLMKLLPNLKNRAIKIEGGSHIIMLEKPFYKQFQTAIWEFLNSNDPF